jgi:GNAT superfamily N-acetyltransferase
MCITCLANAAAVSIIDQKVSAGELTPLGDGTYATRGGLDEHFGTWPDCRRTDGYINIGRSQWFYCRQHKTCWIAGSNLFSDWRRTSVPRHVADREVGAAALAAVHEGRETGRTTKMAGSITRQVRAGNAEDALFCADIVTGLPEFFTPDVVEKVRRDFAAHDSWVIVEDDVVTGFAILERRGPTSAEVLWAATSAVRRNRRIGTALIEHVLNDLRKDGTQLVEVKTLDPLAGYAPYAATYAFWTARGFVHVDTIDPLPDWVPGNPCAILIAAITPTR